jgi:hypothetical protein
VAAGIQHELGIRHGQVHDVVRLLGGQGALRAEPQRRDAAGRPFRARRADGRRSEAPMPVAVDLHHPLVRIRAQSGG